MDGCYNGMLRGALDVHWREHITKKELYGDLPKISSRILRMDYMVLLRILLESINFKLELLDCIKVNRNFTKIKNIVLLFYQKTLLL